MLFVERSNRTERLLEGLAQRLIKPGRDPLAPSRVVVQGRGMERWIAQSIARDHGVLANTVFPFPRGFLDHALDLALDPTDRADHAAWTVQDLTWRIARHLAAGRSEPDYRPLARHLDAVDGDWRLVQLAHRIAGLFDQYITYRPDWVDAWVGDAALTLPSSRREDRWQRRLFRELHSEIGGGHIAERAMAFDRALSSPDAESIGQRLREAFGDATEIFAISTLPPLYLRMIDRLATVCDVHLSVLTPSRHYWADLWQEVEDASEDLSSTAEQGGVAASPRFGSVAPVVTLLAGLGRLGGDFQRNLETMTDAHESGLDLFETPGQDNAVGGASLLERLQRRLLELDVEERSSTADRELGREADIDRLDRTDRIVSREDDSIQIHLCHGTRRELEVVESCLRDAFERDASLRPEDVLVMAPNMDEIAPDVSAVFGRLPGESGGIPFRVADRGTFRSAKVASAFRDLLALLSGRAARSEIFDWMANESVAARFGLGRDGAAVLAEWSERAGIRFGIDEDHRERLGLTRERAHTVSGGLDRLALAHAVGSGESVFAGVSAAPLEPLGDPNLLGALGDLVSILTDAYKTAAEPRSVRAWCAWLSQLQERLFERTDANSHEHALIGEALRALSEAATAANFDQAIPFEAIRERFGFAVESAPSAQPFLSGGVTFCELVPLRAIPFRVVVLLGMSDQAFPRGQGAAGFDLMARDPRPGDRTTRNDDRYLFLEALLSARDRLIVTVPGRDIRDGRDLPMSVVLADLLDMIAGDFRLDAERPADGRVANVRAGKTFEDADRLREWLVVAHPLQASSPRYFESTGDPRLRGRDEDAYQGAKIRRAAQEAGGGPERQFLVTSTSSAAEQSDQDKTPGAVSPTDPRIGHLSLQTLVQRILRSTRTYAREDLGLRLPRPEAAPEDLDPILLAGLEQHGRAAAMLDLMDAGASIDDAMARLVADPSAPAGVAGRLALDGIRAEVEEIAQVLAARCAGERLRDVDFSLDLELAPALDPPRASSVATTVRLTGRLDRLWSEGRVVSGFTRIGGRAEMALWIRHLVLCVLVEEEEDENQIVVPPRSLYVGRPPKKGENERVVRFEAVANARARLTQLVEWASDPRHAPLRCFPRSSWEFATKAVEGKTDQGWRNAFQRFEGGEGFNQSTPEFEEELEMARVWEGRSPLAPSHEGLSSLSFDQVSEDFLAPLLCARKLDVR